MRSLRSGLQSLLLTTLIGVGVVLAGSAQAQSAAPVTATCKDGTSFSGKSKRGACAHHGGVQAFTSAEGSASAAPAPAASPQTAQPAAPAKMPKAAQAAPPAAPARPVASAQPPAPTPQAKTARQSQSAGTDQVWVNPVSKIYHCPGTRYHGKTNAGEYMTEAAAKAKGYRPSRGKECT